MVPLTTVFAVLYNHSASSLFSHPGIFSHFSTSNVMTVLHSWIYTANDWYICFVPAKERVKIMTPSFDVARTLEHGVYHTMVLFYDYNSWPMHIDCIASHYSQVV